MISVVLQLLSGIGCAIVPWFQVLLLMKLLSALATGGTMVTSYVICKCLDPQIYEAIIREDFFSTINNKVKLQYPQLSSHIIFLIAILKQIITKII